MISSGLESRLHFNISAFVVKLSFQCSQLNSTIRKLDQINPVAHVYYDKSDIVQPIHYYLHNYLIPRDQTTLDFTLCTDIQW